MQGLNAEQRERLARKYGRRFRRGDVIFREGEPALEAYWLQEGRVRLVKRVQGVERTLMTLHEHDLYGETALLAESVRGATAIAVEDGLHLVLQRETLTRILEASSEAAMKLILQLVRRLSEAEDQIELMMVRDAQAKIVGALLKMAKARGERGPGPVTLKVSPLELSEWLGIDLNTVRMGVNRLRNEQYVRVVNETLEIPRLEALSQLYGLLVLKDEIRGAGSSRPPAPASGAKVGEGGSSGEERGAG